MIELLRELEPRFYARDTIIYEADDDIIEMLFISKGIFSVGYDF